MATFSFPKLKLKKEDIDTLLNGEQMKGFNRLAIQFYRRQGDKFTLVAQILDIRRKKITDSPVIFIDADDSSSDSYKTDHDVMFLQHELTKNEIIKLSDHGKKDIIFTPRSININPDGVTYDANGNPVNPCPPAIPPEG